MHSRPCKRTAVLLWLVVAALLTVTAIVCGPLQVMATTTTRPATTTMVEEEPAPPQLGTPGSARRTANSDGGVLSDANFVIVDRLSDGEFERRIHFNGLKAKETSLTQEIG